MSTGTPGAPPESKPHDERRLQAAHESLQSARAATATGPSHELESLRHAYLDLLKLTLCDLAGTRTAGCGAMADGKVIGRDLFGDQLRVRAAGLDWPVYGLTMVGLARLDDLQSCVETVVRDGVEGDVVEAGSWRGGASIFLRATLNSLGATDTTLYVCDSFQGFPQDTEQTDESKLYAYDFLAVPLEEVKANFARFGVEENVEFVPGFFENTLSGLADKQWSIVRLDGDSYEATMIGLECLYPGLAPGGYLIADDFGAVEGCERAVLEFRERHGITEPIERIDWTGARWRRESDAPIPRVEPGAGGNGAAPPKPVKRTPDRRVPTQEELNLEEEVADLRKRLAEAEAEIARLRESPVNQIRRRFRR